MKQRGRGGGVAARLASHVLIRIKGSSSLQSGLSHGGINKLNCAQSDEAERRIDGGAFKFRRSCRFHRGFRVFSNFCGIFFIYFYYVFWSVMCLLCSDGKVGSISASLCAAAASHCALQQSHSTLQLFFLQKAASILPPPGP